jgi:acetyl esterase/lipase
VIGGDSAGGHLALSLLSHVMHQYPDETFPALGLSAPLSGCFLVSPLVSLDLDTLSYRENLHADLLSIPVIRDWGEDLFKGSPFSNEKLNGKGWGMALSGDKDWWNRLGRIVQRVYLVGGGEELFRDHIIEFGDRLKNVEGVDVSIYIDVEEAHDRTFMDFETGAPLSRSTIRLGNWVVESLALSN